MCWLQGQKSLSPFLKETTTNVRGIGINVVGLCLLKHAFLKKKALMAVQDTKNSLLGRLLGGDMRA